MEEIKNAIIAQYELYGDKKILLIGDKSYTGNELALEIKNNTEIGKKQIENVVKLTVDLLARNKIK